MSSAFQNVASIETWPLPKIEAFLCALRDLCVKKNVALYSNRDRFRLRSLNFRLRFGASPMAMPSQASFAVTSRRDKSHGIGFHRRSLSNGGQAR